LALTILGYAIKKRTGDKRVASGEERSDLLEKPTSGAKGKKEAHLSCTQILNLGREHMLACPNLQFTAVPASQKIWTSAPINFTLTLISGNALFR